MIAKRFRVIIENKKDVRLVDCIDNRQLISISFKEFEDAIDCGNALLYQCNLMNELYGENRELKQQVDFYKYFQKDARELEKENEQLKTQLQNISDQRDEFHRGARENANRVRKLEKENEWLKNKLKFFNELNKPYGDIIKENEQLKSEINMLKNTIGRNELYIKRLTEQGRWRK